MMRGETEEVQRRIRQADDRSRRRRSRGEQISASSTPSAAQRRNVRMRLRELLDVKMNLLLVVGGYNSSNTSHLAEMGEEKLPTYFIRNASRLRLAKPRSCITICTRRTEIDRTRLAADRPARCRHHSRRVLPEQPDRRDADPSF